MSSTNDYDAGIELLKELAAETCHLSGLAQYDPSSGLYVIPSNHYQLEHLLLNRLLQRVTGGDYSPELNNLELEMKMMCQEIRELRALVTQLGGNWDEHRRNFPQVLTL